MAIIVEIITIDDNQKPFSGEQYVFSLSHENVCGARWRNSTNLNRKKQDC